LVQHRTTFLNTDSSQRKPLLVYTSDSEDEDIVLPSGSKSSTMASKATEVKTSAVETHERHVGDSYKSSDGLEGNGDGSGSIEMVGERGVNGVGDEVDPEALEHAIEALEKKKTAWYAYLTTRDFWIVLMIGYVLSIGYCYTFITNGDTDKSLHSASRAPTPSLPSSSTKELQFLLSRHSSIMSLSPWCTPRTQSTGTDGRNISSSSS
jgi:hypothetical protein